MLSQVLGASEIKLVATARSLGTNLLPPEARTPALAIFLALFGLVVADGQNPDAASLVAAAKPFFGGGLASVFAFVLYGAANAGRSAARADEAAQGTKRAR
jgi:hypothetical protein